MARTRVQLTADVWTDLGAGPGTMELLRKGDALGTVLHVNNSQTTNSVHRMHPGDIGHQVVFTGTEVASCFAQGPGWEVTWDPEP